MLGKTRTSLLSLAVIAVLIFSAIGPTIVYADDGQPPDTTAPHIVDQDDDSDNGDGIKCDSDKGAGKHHKKGNKNKSANKDSGKCNPTGGADESGGSESGSDVAAPDQSGSGDSAEGASEPAADTPPADLLSQVPENTSVTVLNADGQAEPLATQESANAIAT